jgi:hypothetical protein
MGRKQRGEGGGLLKWLAVLVPAAVALIAWKWPAPTVNVSTCTPNDTQPCQSGQGSRTCAEDGRRWSKCNRDPGEVTKRGSSSGAEFCVVADVPPRGVYGCFDTIARCQAQQAAVSSGTDAYGRSVYYPASCVANPAGFACLTWADEQGMPQLWCYGSMPDCSSQNLGACSWVERR